LTPLAAFFASQAVALLAGWALLVALSWSSLPVGLLVPTAWLAGTGTLALERLLLAQAGLPWNAVTIGLPWLVVVLLALRRLKPRVLVPKALLHMAGRNWRDPMHQGRLNLLIELVASTLIVVWTWGMFRMTLSMPMVGWDALINWVFKGRVLYFQGTVPYTFFTDQHYAVYSHPDYPLLVPLTVAHIYEWTGDNADLVRGWWALLAGAAVAGVYFGCGGALVWPTRLGGLVVLVCMPAMIVYAAGPLAGYAELPLAVSFLYAGLFLYRWLDRPAACELGLSALFFGMAGFTKNEGLVMALAGLVLLMALAVLRRVGLSAIWQMIPAMGLMIMPWQIQRVVWGIKGDMNVTLAALMQNWDSRSSPVLQYLLSNMGNIHQLGLLWYVLPPAMLGALAFAPRQWLKALPVLLLIVAHFAGVIAAYITTSHDIIWHLNTSADRVVFQVSPLAVMLGLIYTGCMFDRSAGVAAWSARIRALNMLPTPTYSRTS
jgi:hypothetical protein